MTYNVRLTGGAAGAGGGRCSSWDQHVNFVFLAEVVTTVLSPTTLVPPRQSLHGAGGDLTGLDKSQKSPKSTTLKLCDFAAIQWWQCKLQNLSLST